MSYTEEEFEKLAEEINAKLADAASSLKEANDLAKKAGMDALINTEWTSNNLRGAKLEQFRKNAEKIDVSGLENELNQAGWSTSSSYC